MAITTATELRTAIVGWTKSDDLETAQLDEFIAIAEARFNRDLRVRQMEAALTATAIADGYIALPDSMLAVRSLWVVDNDNTQLYAQTYDYIISHDFGGIATHWALAGDRIYFNGTGTVEGLVYTAIPPLSTNDSNWLLTSHPDLYLYACLEEAAIFENDMQRGSLWGQRAAALLDMIQAKSERDLFVGGPLSVAAR